MTWLHESIFLPLPGVKVQDLSPDCLVISPKLLAPEGKESEFPQSIFELVYRAKYTSGALFGVNSPVILSLSSPSEVSLNVTDPPEL